MNGRHLAALAAVVLATATGSNSLGRQCDPADAPCLAPIPVIAFTSTMATPDAMTRVAQFRAAEIYLMNDDGTALRRLTNNEFLDVFATLSPDGLGKIVFDSNRLRVPPEPLNTSDLFLMKADGSEPETHLIRGGSPTWSPDSKFIAFHASASGTGLPIKGDVAAATADSDIFIANLDDLLDGTGIRFNVTNDPLQVDDDPDWSPVASQLVFTRHGVNDPHGNSVTAEIHIISTDGSGLTRLTYNDQEERAPDWSPDGSRIAFMCRWNPNNTSFELCVMNADGSDQRQLTANNLPDLGPHWSPDGARIVFHRDLGTGINQLFTINADGTDERPLTSFPGNNLLADWGLLKIGRHPR